MSASESIRLNKAISDSGYCSRREADALIAAGKVTVNGNIAGLGDRVTDDDQIEVEGNPIGKSSKPVYIAFNKPVGITCTTDRHIKGNVIDYINHPERIFYIGRLDKPSEGLLLLTNDGDIVNKILRAGNQHEKEYVVEVDRPVTSEFIHKMSNGVPVLDTVTKKCEVEKLNRNTFRIVLVQGLNRQIRRMCEYLGHKVVSLKRTRVMNIKLEGLETGAWRDLTIEELKGLKDAVARSDNRTYVQRQQATRGKRRRK